MTRTNTLGFVSTGNKGFQMEINNFRISVQWGPGNMVDKNVRFSEEDPQTFPSWQSDTAEIMLWDRHSNNLFHQDDDFLDAEVIGNLSAASVARIMGVLVNAHFLDDVRPAISQIVNAQ